MELLAFSGRLQFSRCLRASPRNQFSDPATPPSKLQARRASKAEACSCPHGGSRRRRGGRSGASYGPGHEGRASGTLVRRGGAQRGRKPFGGSSRRSDAPQPFLDRVAQRLARKLGKPTFGFSGSEEGWQSVVSFDARGKEAWHENSRDELPQKALTAALRKKLRAPKLRMVPLHWPYWRMASELPARPRLPFLNSLIELGWERKAPWRQLATLELRFSPEHTARLAEAARLKAEADQAARVAEDDRRLKAELAAREAVERKVEPKDVELMDRTLATGAPHEVLLPENQHRTVVKLALKYVVSPAWVWQAAAARSTPWKFPPSALPACPNTSPLPVQLVISPALKDALAKSTLARAPRHDTRRVPEAGSEDRLPPAGW